jgi:hypothetical protein
VARVFISYRRADGQYAVGWIEERLRAVYQDGSVTMAFRDSDLRYGQDFPKRLAAEVDACDVLIAVIGPRWRGDDDGEPARILDPADWVGREITSALDDPDKLIIPVLLSGVEPLRASDLSPEHRRFADLHALRFNVRDDLEEVVDQIQEHLNGLDAARNRLTGLDRPLPQDRWRPSSRDIGLAMLAATVGVLVSLAVRAPMGSGDLAWEVFSAVQGAYWFAAFVIGRAYVRGRLAGVFDVRWKMVVAPACLAIVLIGLTIISLAPGNAGQRGVTFAEAVVAVLVLSPWILALIGAGWSRTTETAIAPRAVRLLRQRRALGAATAVLVVALGLTVCTSAALLEPNPERDKALAMVGFGVFLSLVVIGGVEYAHARIRLDSDLLRLEIVELGEVAKAHVAPALVTGRADLWPGVALLTAVPTLVAIVTALVIW